MKALFIVSILLSTFTTYAKTDPKFAYQMVEEGRAVIVDAREKEEIKRGMINQALWFPESRLKDDKDWVDSFKKLTTGRPAFLYCRSGRRSENMAELLNKSGQKAESIGGFEDIKHFLPSHRPKGK